MRLRCHHLLAEAGIVAVIAASLSVGGAALTTAAFAVPAGAVNVDYTGFDDVSGVAFVGTTSVAAGSALQTTNNTDGNQAGGFWLKTPIDPSRDLSSSFVYETFAGATPPGNGFTFTIQNAGLAALGSCGAGLGYAASPCDGHAAISSSEAYGFDALDGNEILDGVDGVLSDASATYVDPHDGTFEQAWIDYDAATHSLALYTAAEGAPKPAIPTAHRTIAALSSWSGVTYVGFTGGTGSAMLTQIVKRWSVHQPLDAPGAVTAVAGAAGQPAGHAPVVVSWTPPADDPDSGTVASYTVYRSTDAAVRGGVVGTVTVAALADPAQPSFRDTTARGGTAYYYTVTDTANDMESPGTRSTEVIAPKTLPSAPVGLTVDSTVSGPAVSTGGAAVTLGWDGPTDLGGDPSVDFDVFRSVNGASFVKIADGIQPDAGTSETYQFTDQNLTAGHYSYKVQAVNTQGSGPVSDTVTADLVTAASAPVAAAASAPQDPHLALDGNGRTVFAWSPPADLGGSTVDHYTVYRAVGDETAPSTSFTLYQDGVAGTSLPTQVIPAGTGFVSYYVVAVMANASTTAASATATVFVPETPLVTSTSSPSNGRAVVTGTVPNLPAGVSVSFAALAFDGAVECTTCVSTPDGDGADVDGLGTGGWRFRLVPTTSYGGNTAQGPASALSATTVTLHTIRYVSAANGDDAQGVGAHGNDCTVPGAGVTNGLDQTAPCATIGQALARAAAGDEVLVGAGTYAEGADISTGSGPATGSFGFFYTGLAVTKSLQLVADATDGAVVIDAAGHNNGLVIDRGDNFDNTGGVGGSSPTIDPDVVVSGFTVQNADAEGLFAFNSDALRIANNIIQNNDKGSFTTSIADDLGECAADGADPGDCGGGLHLDGVTRSVVIDNTVSGNSRGIVLDDGLENFPDVSVPNEGNTVTGNTVVDNTVGDGIAIVGDDTTNLFGGFSLGVFNNVISDNVSSGNGIDRPGAGVLLDVGAPGDGVYQNVVHGNVLDNDGLPGVAIHAHDALAYMDDNVIEANHIAFTGSDPSAGANVPAGVVVHGLAADPIGGTIIKDNVISDVQYGVFLNEAWSSLSGNTFSRVSVAVTSIPAAKNIYGFRGANGHLFVNGGVVGQAIDMGGALAAGTAPAVGAVPTWNPNAFGPGFGYWSGGLSPMFAARTTKGRIAVRSTSVLWTNLPAPTSRGALVAFVGSPAIAGSVALDNGLDGGRSLLGVAAISSRGELWVTSVVVGPSRNVVGVSRPWRNFGHPAGTTLVGTPALAGLFFVNTAWAAATNGYVYSLSFDPSTADWKPAGQPWIKHGYKATTVAASTSPDGYRTALLLASPYVTKPGERLTRLVFVNGVQGKLGAVNAIAMGQPSVAIATNGITEAYAAGDLTLRATGAITRNFKAKVAGGVGAVALN